MSGHSLERAFAIFDAALAHAGTDRVRVVAEACRDDPQLRDEVESLLAAHEEAPDFLSNARSAMDGAAGPGRRTIAALTSGSRLGVFEIERFVDAGGMGEVYRARDTRLNRPVAIKILSPIVAAGPSARARFIHEARILASLSHPNICALYDLGQDRVDYLVMEYLEGKTLADSLRRRRLPAAAAIRIALEIVEALAAGHSRGVVHRDLKPANVMLTPTGVKLLDFRPGSPPIRWIPRPLLERWPDRS